MSEPSENKSYCRYTTVKLDIDVLPLARIAAAIRQQKLQDFISDVVNDQSAKISKRKSVTRKPPPPSKKRGPKSAD